MRHPNQSRRHPAVGSITTAPRSRGGRTGQRHRDKTLRQAGAQRRSAAVGGLLAALGNLVISPTLRGTSGGGGAGTIYWPERLTARTGLNKTTEPRPQYGSIPIERAVLAAGGGEAAQLALAIQIKVGAFLGAEEFVPVRPAHLAADAQSVREFGVGYLRSTAGGGGGSQSQRRLMPPPPIPIAPGCSDSARSGKSAPGASMQPWKRWAHTCP